ncbi:MULTISPECIES: hypothetical protein [unclassified Streptomyces]|uniref:hypothetical protein n=1 Tax=unclassified Streptomyces TaxID=2593676 RepID=UPI0006B0193C|nr:MULTISPECIES: hypothetical protein [unclassified Streptomyces]KOX34267.1 hypothetical protein ADL06_07695 [Streptomyces sp. NRRL F-6491]KOX42301.1 hypothetical protein ADL08_16455 [Streptomyces sp. NRRL F-6492]
MTDTTTERDPFAIARNAIPGLRDHLAADTVLQQRIAELRSADSLPAVDLGAETFQALTSGGSLPESIGRRAWEVQQAQVFREAELRVLLGVEKRMKNSGENLAKAGVDKGLRALRPVLAELLDQARPMVAALRGVHDAQTAIDRGPDAIAAWTGIGDVVSQYAEIRSAQHTLTRLAAGQDFRTEFGHLGFNAVYQVWSEIENVTEVWPEWAPGEQDTGAPWPMVHRRRPFEVKHDREWLLWLLTNPKVRLWVPTLGELVKAYEGQRKAAIERRDQNEQKPRTGERRHRPVLVSDGTAVHTYFERIED